MGHTGSIQWGRAKPLIGEPYVHAGWRYDPSFQISDYTFSNLDLTTMTNISSGDQRLWVHLLSCWVISLFVWRVRQALSLRDILSTIPLKGHCLLRKARLLIPGY